MSEPRIRIKVDGKWVFKGNLGDWNSRPPTEFKNAIKPGATPEPHMKAIMVALADAALQRQSIDIVVQVKPRGFVMDVDRP